MKVVNESCEDKSKMTRSDSAKDFGARRAASRTLLQVGRCKGVVLFEIACLPSKHALKAPSENLVALPSSSNPSKVVTSFQLQPPPGSILNRLSVDCRLIATQHWRENDSKRTPWEGSAWRCSSRKRVSLVQGVAFSAVD